MNFAGDKLVNFFLHNPVGEEIGEGTLGGLLAGGAMLGSDQSLGQTALQTAAAIAGGIGLGMGGRRIGAVIGKRLHPKALANQDSLVANLSRMAGSETTAAGLKHQGAVMKQGIQEALINETSSALMREAAADPKGFMQKYKIDPAVFQQLAPKVAEGRIAASAVKALGGIDPRIAVEAIKSNPQARQALKSYEQVENLITSKSAADIDDNLLNIANYIDDLQNPAKRGGDDDAIAEMMDSLSSVGVSGQSLRDMMTGAPPVTGEEVGRAIGRALGDEIGVLSGLALGGVAADQLGLESEKDRKIKQLQQELNKQY